LKSRVGFESSLEGKYIASIDFGSHTARFLLGEICAPPTIFRPVLRKRVYTNLAEGFNKEGSGVITENAMERAINAITEFSAVAKAYSVEYITGAATGIMRRAVNGHDLLRKIREATGIEIDVVSGEEEASLTLQGISHALKLTGYPDAFFDLGGSTTEIIIKRGDNKEIYSFPVGAFVLKEQYLKHDPPLESEIKELKQYVDGVFQNGLTTVSRKDKGFQLIGSGGTATSLIAMAMGLNEHDVTPERINGAHIDMDMIRSIYLSIRKLTFPERLRLKCIDEGRAEVILSGTIVVISIMEFFSSDSLTVSYSDILEGLLISYLKGEKDE
jgi:exopolyphosphatase / guanosine-5'-triphosphate,3'-diphosphate pyrophosphatase